MFHIFLFILQLNIADGKDVIIRTGNKIYLAQVKGRKNSKEAGSDYQDVAGWGNRIVIKDKRKVVSNPTQGHPT